MATNSIGAFNFISLQQPDGNGAVPELLRQDLKVIQRPGVDGTGIKRQGVKGEPFQLQSVVDMPTRAEAEDLRFLYIALQQGEQKADLVLNDIDYASFHGVRFVVQRVEKVFIQRMSAAVGGLSSPSNYVVRATWTLIPVHA